MPILEERCKRLEANVSELEYHCEKVTASNEVRHCCLIFFLLAIFLCYKLHS